MTDKKLLQIEKQIAAIKQQPMEIGEMGRFSYETV